MTAINDQIAAAYQAGDIGTVNNLVAQSNMTADQANSIWGGGIADLAAQKGVNFAPSASATTQPAALAAPPAPTDYSSVINNAYAGIGRTGIGTNTSNIDQGGYDYWNKQLQTGALTPETFQSAFNNAVDTYTRDRPTDPYTQYVQNFQKTQAENSQIKDYVSKVLADKALTPWEQTNKIMEQAQKSGFDQSRLESVYGKDAVAPYMETYKKGINDYINKTLATDPTKTTFDEVGQIHQAAAKYGLTPDEIAKYAGMDPKQAQSYFDLYNQGLGTVMARLNDPKVDDLTKTQTALSLQQKYGATDEELAKASGGKYTTADVKAYLEPVRNVPTNLQKLLEDPNTTAADIQKFVTEAKADPRAAGIYGAALDKFATNNPTLFLRDAANGNNASESYQKFLAAAKSTPELATQYAPQIKLVEQALSVTARARDKDFGGKVPDYAMEMFLGLDKKTQAGVPKALEMTAPKTETRTGYDGESGTQYTYQVNIPAELKTGQKGVEPVYGVGDEYGPGAIEGYRQKVTSGPFKNLYANYDITGKLTGYDDHSSRVHVSDPQYYYAKFDANGNPIPGTGVNSSGGWFKNTVQDIASMGPIGTIALMAATGGLGGLAAGALEASLGSMAANAVGSGLASGLISEVAGGDFGKGFVGGGVGNLAGNFVGANMPTNVTGNAFVDSYLTKAAPNLAASTASAAVTGRDVGDAGVASLFNTGLNMGTNSLINTALPDTLTPAQQKWASGIGSGLLKSAITGQPIDVGKSIQNAAIQQALQTGRKG